MCAGRQRADGLGPSGNVGTRRVAGPEIGLFLQEEREIYADGDRLKITEWPDHTEDDTQTLETYFLGQTVVKVFPWNGSRVGLVFEATEPLPAPNAALKASSYCHPFPRCLRKRARFPAGKGASTTSEMCPSSPSMTSCSPRAASWKTPSNRQTTFP